MVINKVVLLLALILMLVNLFLIDIDDLSWEVNNGSYKQIIAMLCVSISMLIAIRTKKKSK